MTAPAPRRAPRRADRPDMAARVLFRDAHVIVLDKPAGVASHAGPASGPNMESHLDDLRFGFERRPQLAHRLDRDTSGCLVLGRHPKALARLGALFAEGRVGKTYWAVVLGSPQLDEGTIDLPLAKQERRDGWWMAVDPKAGRPAVTDYRVLGRGPGIAWVEMRPRTGRTHQVRVHAAAFGWPVLGDPVYSDPPPGVPLHLHARAVEVPYAKAGAPIAAAAPPPDHMALALSDCGWKG